MPRILRIVSQPQSEDFELQFAVGNAPLRTIYMKRNELLSLLTSGDRALVSADARKMNRPGE